MLKHFLVYDLFERGKRYRFWIILVILPGLLCCSSLTGCAPIYPAESLSPPSVVSPESTSLSKEALPSAPSSPTPVPAMASLTPAPTPIYPEPTCFQMSYDDSAPMALWGSQVLFITPDPETLEVVDLETGEQRLIVIPPIKRCEYFATVVDPVIHGDWVAWKEMYSPEEGRLYAFNLETEEERAISPPDIFPGYITLYEERLVWTYYREGKDYVVLYDLSTGNERVVDMEGRYVNRVRLWENWLVYEAGKEEEDSTGIVAQHLDRGEKRWVVTSTIGLDILDIEENKILYDDLEDYDWPHRKVCVYDLSTDQVECLIVGESTTSFDIWGDLIVWQEEVADEPQVHVYSLKTRNVVQITAAAQGASYPHINAQYLVWFQEILLDHVDIPHVCYLTLDQVQSWVDDEDTEGPQ